MPQSGGGGVWGEGGAGEGGRLVLLLSKSEHVRAAPEQRLDLGRVRSRAAAAASNCAKIAVADDGLLEASLLVGARVEGHLVRVSRDEPVDGHRLGLPIPSSL